MKPGNRSTVTEFIMIALTNNPERGLLLFLLLLPVYIITLLGNISIRVIVVLSTSLHTPMYFFLTQLAFLDIAFSSVISPKMLVDLLKEKKVISYSGCMAQTYFMIGCGTAESFLLAVMAFDRYVAICNPLQYTLTMTTSLCVGMVVVSYMGGFRHSLIHLAFLLVLDLCGSNVIDHFVCDNPLFLMLSCNDIYVNQMVRFIFTLVAIGGSLVVISVSYVFIFRALLRVRTTGGRNRATTTCISHFICISLFYGSGFLMEPNSRSAGDTHKEVALTPTVLIPALNPLIYSLRNKNVKEAPEKDIAQGSFFYLITPTYP